MSRVSIVILCATVVLFSYLMSGCDAHRIQYDDLEVAASGKEEKWAKGDESDHHDDGFDKKGKEGDKGYDAKHRYVVNLNRLIVSALFFVFLSLLQVNFIKR